MNKFLGKNNFFSCIKKGFFIAVTLFISTYIPNSIAKTQDFVSSSKSTELEEKLQIINSTLANYPAQNNSKYTEVNRITINSRGKLTLYKQYQVPASCTASKEEVFLTDLEPTNISSFAKDATMVITVGCKSNKGNCVQRFFRNSCEVTFKPESFQKELLIVSSANLRNTEELRNTFSELIKLANGSQKQNDTNLENKESQTTNQPNDLANNSNQDKITSPLATTTPKAPIVFLNPPTSEKKRRIALTMEDVEAIPKKKKPAQKPTQKPKPNVQNTETPNKENLTEEDINEKDLDVDKLLELLLKND